MLNAECYVQNLSKSLVVTVQSGLWLSVGNNLDNDLHLGCLSDSFLHFKGYINKIILHLSLLIYLSLSLSLSLSHTHTHDRLTERERERERERDTHTHTHTHHHNHHHSLPHSTSNTHDITQTVNSVFMCTAAEVITFV